MGWEAGSHLFIYLFIGGGGEREISLHFLQGWAAFSLLQSYLVCAWPPWRLPETVADQMALGSSSVMCCGLFVFGSK